MCRTSSTSVTKSQSSETPLAKVSAKTQHFLFSVLSTLFHAITIQGFVDIIKLLSLTSLDSADPTWTFRLTTDGEHPILVDVGTVEGRRQYTPAFIFALISKWIILQIKKGTGDFIDQVEIEFRLPLINRALKENIVAAFRMLKINLVFV